MSEVLTFIPTHAKIEQLAWQYVNAVEDFETPDEDQRERVRAYAAGYLFAAGEREYQTMMHTPEYRDQPTELVAEIAFWRGVHNTLAHVARYVIAEKMKFALPRI